MCGKRLDLAGIQLWHLTVLEATDHRSSQGSIIWRCRCDCGNEILLPSSSIRNSHIADCGCRRSKRYANADITGQRFGRLAALYATDRRDNSGYKIWHCYCDCGNEIDVSYKALQLRISDMYSHPSLSRTVSNRSISLFTPISMCLWIKFWG